jgi:hypothetical protein
VHNNDVYDLPKKISPNAKTNKNHEYFDTFNVIKNDFTCFSSSIISFHSYIIMNNDDDDDDDNDFELL